MTVRQRIALIQMLGEFGTLLELDGANAFKSGAYHRAVRSLTDYQGDLGVLLESGRATEIDGVGKGIAEKIDEFLKTGHIEELDALRVKYPRGLVELTELPGLGAKKVRALFDALQIDSLATLEAACVDGRLASQKGFGKKTVENLLVAIAQRRQYAGRFLLDEARHLSDAIVGALRDHEATIRAEATGSVRRWKETVKDLDFVVSTEDPGALMEYFATMPGASRVLAQGPTKTSILLQNGMQADLRCVNPVQFPWTLHHFTGSKEHNTAMRSIAKERGLRLNEYGLFPEGSDVSLPAESEADVFGALCMMWIPPELREDSGEIAAATARRLPPLLRMDQIRGMAHMHTQASDGQPTLEDYVEWGLARKIQWLGIADHSQTAAYAGGLTPERVLRQHEQIDALNADCTPKGFRLLKGIESDILGDGSLDYEPALLQRFDFIVASVHSGFNLSEAEMTARIIRAIENPYTTILGHATGRLLLRREGYPVDQHALIRACVQNGVAIEINANPYRLDIDWRVVRYAVEQGCWLSIGPDAHTIGGLDHLVFGVAMARKGWSTQERVLNCLSADDFLAFARRRRPA